MVTSFNESIAAGAEQPRRWLRRGIASLLSADPKLGRNRGRQGARPALRHLPWAPQFGSRPSGPATSGLDADAGRAVDGGRRRDDAFAKVADIRALADKLPPESPIRSVLIDLCARAATTWTASANSSTTGSPPSKTQLTAWYRQKTQYVLIGLSLAVAVAMKRGTPLDIVRQFSADPKVLRAVVEQAQSAGRTKRPYLPRHLGPRRPPAKPWEEAVKATRRPTPAVRPRRP